MNRIPKEKRRPYVWKKSTNLKKTLYEFLFQRVSERASARLQEYPTGK
jgi:hypothetical protein